MGARFDHTTAVFIREVNMQRSQHPSNNAVIGAPPGMTIDQCTALPITRVQYADGTKVMMSYWQPTEFERDLILSGRPVRLSILGNGHPPVLLGVDGDGL
jgi:hypothetical protein